MGRYFTSTCVFVCDNETHTKLCPGNLEISNVGCQNLYTLYTCMCVFDCAVLKASILKAGVSKFQAVMYMYVHVRVLLYSPVFAILLSV